MDFIYVCVCVRPTGPTNCQRAQAHTLLSGWRKSSDVSITVPPQCDEVGSDKKKTQTHFCFNSIFQ